MNAVGTAAARRLVVLEATSPPDGTTRYIDQVVTDAPDDIEFRFHSWRHLVFGRFDVVHFHWPEVLVRDRSRLRSLGNKVLLLVAIVRFRLSSTQVVRTMHNVEPHEPGGLFEGWTLRRLDAVTDYWVAINDSTPEPRRGRTSYVPHGHYRDRFSSSPRATLVRGRVLHSGLIRPYKGVDRLIESFRAMQDTELTLRIVGRATAEIGPSIELATRRDPRISARLEFVPDRDLVREITAAEIVCLPYRELHNSGMLLVALSLDRPVLVPSTASTESLAREVGDGWVHRYTGELDSTVLERALQRVRDEPPAAPPELLARDWEVVAAGYATVFREAVARRGERASRAGTHAPRS